LVKYWTGWCTTETLALQWSQVDFALGVIRLEVDTTKNDDGRELPFSMLPDLEAVLLRQYDRTEALEKATGQTVPWVFHRAGKRIKDFLDGWHTACKKAGFPGRRPHDFRRTAVRRYERAGVSRSVATKLTGHKTESVYRRYAIVSSVDLREGLAKVAALQRWAPPVNGNVPKASRKVPAKSGPLEARMAAG
jgi:integrase